MNCSCRIETVQKRACSTQKKLLGGALEVNIFLFSAMKEQSINRLLNTSG